MLNKVTQGDIDAAVEVARQTSKVYWFNQIIKETVPWVQLTPPIHEEEPPIVLLKLKGSGEALASGECSRFKDKEESYVNITVGKCIVNLREDIGDKGEYFYFDTPLDDYYANLNGVSTSCRGPLHDIAHIYMNRGNHFGAGHRNNNHGYALYLAYQVSHQLKAYRNQKKAA